MFIICNLIKFFYSNVMITYKVINNIVDNIRDNDGIT